MRREKMVNFSEGVGVVGERSMKRWRIVATLLACCVASGCASLAEAGAGQEPIRVAALGTSLTHSGGWLKPLEKHLAECLERPINVIDFGRDGATSGWGLAILEEVIHAEPDIILIEFSVNDAALFKGLSLGQSRENVRKIVLTVRNARPQVRIFLMTMSPSFGPRAWIRPSMAAYYDAYRDLADELGIGYIDSLPDWKKLSRRELRAGIPDGLHPTPEWSRRILVPAIAGAIGGTVCVETRMNG